MLAPCARHIIISRKCSRNALHTLSGLSVPLIDPSVRRFMSGTFLNFSGNVLTPVCALFCFRLVMLVDFIEGASGYG
eukprot:COSAG06_NODE_5177_length_3657_cov_4.933671_2_plen_77_part_00